jgi:hypothetical protein
VIPRAHRQLAPPNITALATSPIRANLVSNVRPILKSRRTWVGCLGVVLMTLSPLLAILNTHPPAPGRTPLRTDGEPAATFMVLDEPRRIDPVPVPGIITRQELDRVLTVVRPSFSPRRMVNKVPLSLILHSLRLWGQEVEFPTDPEGLEPRWTLGSRRMIATLLDNQEFLKTSRVMSAGLLARSPHGIQVLSTANANFGALDTSTHFGKLLQVMAEIGMPSRQPVRTGDGYVATLREVAQDEAARVVAGSELDFVVCGLSRYARDGRAWKNRFGQRRSLDGLTQELLDRPTGVGSCGGVHQLHALTILLRVDAQRPILSAPVRDRIRARLAEVSRVLAYSQRADGSWPWEWPKLVKGGKPQEVPNPYRREVVVDLVVVGHHLEWMALAPPELRPPAETISMAARFLVRSWPQCAAAVEMDWHVFNPLTHAARALWLLSGETNIRTYALGTTNGGRRADQ